MLSGIVVLISLKNIYQVWGRRGSWGKTVALMRVLADANGASVRISGDPWSSAHIIAEA